METKYSLVQGPSKFDLSVALFRGTQNDLVEFAYQSSTGERIIIQCRILSVEAEDGSRESWNICGYAKFQNDPDHRRPWRKFKAYFHTGNRKGHLEISGS